MSELLPRLIRLKDAPAYVGMDRNRFNREVRPTVTEIPIGIQGIAFDRLDLDAWVQQYKTRNGRPSGTNSRSTEPWDAQYRQASSSGANTGTLGSKFSVNDFEKALALSHSTKPKSILHVASRR